MAGNPFGNQLKKKYGVPGITPPVVAPPTNPSFTTPTVPPGGPDPMDSGAFALRLADTMGQYKFPPSMLMQGPNLVSEVAVTLDDRLNMGSAEMGTWLESLYGANITPWLEAAKITDPVQREAMNTALQTALSGGGTTGLEQRTVTAPVGGRGGATTITEYKNPVTGEWTTDFAVANDFTASTGVNTLIQRNAAGIAFLASANTRLDDNGDIRTHYDYGKVLSPGELDQVTQAITNGSTPRSTSDQLAQTFTPFSTNEFKGSFVRVESGSKTYEISEEYAKAHPVRALAISKMIQEAVGPDAEVRIGGQGMLHPATEILGRPIDFVSTPIAVGYKYAARAFGEVGERVSGQFTADDRQRYADTAKQLQEDLKNGVVPMDQVQQTLTDIERFKDWATTGNILNEGESVSNDIHNAFMPESAGTGLAVASADGIGLYPGDAAYAPWVGAVTLIHNMSALDPVGWLGAIRNGVNLAKTTTVGSISGAARSAATSEGLVSALNKGETAASYLQNTQWVRIAASAVDANDAEKVAAHAHLLETVKAAAQKHGYDVLQVTNKDGNPEVMVLGMSAEEGLYLARNFSQDSFQTADGIVHADRTITPVDWARAENPLDVHASDVDVIHAPDAATGFRMDVPDANVRLKPAPPKVSQSWLVQRAFQHFAKTPDELMYSPETFETAGRISEQIEQARGLGIAEGKARGLKGLELAQAARDKVTGVLASWIPQYDMTIAKALAGTRDGNEVHQVLTEAMLGGIRDPLELDKLLTRQAEVAKRLGEIDSELSNYHRLSSEVAALADRFRIGETISPEKFRHAQEIYAGQPVFKAAVDKLNAFRSKLATLDNERIDLLGERVNIKSRLELDDVSIPMRQLPPAKMVEELGKIVKTAGRDPVSDLLVALAKDAESVSDAELARLLKQENITGRNARRILKRAERAREGKSQTVLHAWSQLGTKLTGGQEIHMPVPGHGVPEGQLADYSIRTLNAIRHRAKLFGLSAADTQELLTAYLKVDSREKWFTFVKKFFEDIADKSPFLDAKGREAMRQTHQDLLDERGGGYLTKDLGGYVDREHTLSKTITDPLTGQSVKSGVPAFSGDWLDHFRLPSNEIDSRYLSASKRWMVENAKAGGWKGAGASALMAVRDFNNAFTYAWKSAVLMGRMPFALLARIQGEQAFRMAALDYASSVNHPLEWLKSVLSKGDYKIFEDSHSAFLGTLADNYNDINGFGSKVKVLRRGRTVLSPEDGQRYWNAVSMMVLRRARSPEAAQILTSSNPADVVAWMKSAESGPLGAGLLDNFSHAGIDPLTAVKRMKQELEELAGGRSDVFAAIRTGTLDTKAGKVRHLGPKTTEMNVEELRTRLQFGTARGERTPQQLEDLRTSLKEGYDPKQPIEVWYNPETHKVLVPEGHHRLDALSELGVKDVPVEVKVVDRATIEGVGSMRPPTNPAASIPVPGDPVRAGTTQLGAYLAAEYKAGRYKPPKFINSKASEYAMEDPGSLLGRFRDWAFQKFYSQPDVYLSRGPLFRQMARREYDRLTGLGWSHARAKTAAESFGAEQTADWMYDLGSRTSGQYWLRNIVPFFPAWNELAHVWLARLPAKMGGGGLLGWAAGSALFVHRADKVEHFFQDTGLMKKNSQGVWEFMIPGLDQVYRWMTGEDTATIRFRADSLLGLLPIPGVGTTWPALGPASGAALGALARHNPIIFEIAQHVLPYGNDVTFGPTSINHLFHAANITPPWEYMTADTQRLMMDMSIEDALRSVYADMEPFDPSWSKDKKQAWSEEILHRAEQRSSVHFLTRAAASMLSPASVDISSDYENEMNGIWKFIENYRTGTGGQDAASPLIQGFKDRYPGAVWYTNGKSISHTDRNTADFDSWIREWRAGNITTFTPEEAVHYNMGMTQYWNTVGKEAGNTQTMSAADILLHGFERKDGTSDAWAQFDLYRTSDPLFDRQFSEFQQARDEQATGVSLSAQGDRLATIKRQVESLNGLFTVNGIRDADYLKVIGKITQNIAYVASQTDDPKWKAVNNWWQTVGGPANEQLGALYDQAFSLPKQEQGAIFEQIRELKNSFAGKTVDGVLITPELVTWGNRSPQEQANKKLEWVTGPIEWLSNFEVQKAGYTFGDPVAVNEYSTMVSADNIALQTYAAAHGLSTSSTEYLSLKSIMDARHLQFAQDNGIEDVYTLDQGAPYERVIATNNYEGSQTFLTVAQAASQMRAFFASTGNSAAGSTPEARAAQVALFSMIDTARHNDTQFDALMSRFEVAMASAGRDRAVGTDMYFKLFLDYFGPPPVIPYTNPYTTSPGGSTP